MKTAKLASTSALVILFTMCEIHTSRTAKKFIDMLNLKAGEAIFDKCNRFWPHYAEVVKNRKSCIRDISHDAIGRDGAGQVVIFGAGFDALSLEICSWSDDCRVFEIDIANMNAKSKAIRSVDPSLAGRIRCITMDISDTARIAPRLAREGWDGDLPSLVVFEGISYYLDRATLWDVIGRFRSASRRTRVVLEYLVPNEKILKKHVPIAEYPFNLIADESDLADIVRYDADDIKLRVKRLGGVMLERHDMKRMEKNRTSQNLIFKTRQSGWIEICEFLV